MRKSRVARGRKYKFRDAKLFDATKPLHLARIQEFPDGLIDQAIVIKDDQAVNWVSDTLRLHENKYRTRVPGLSSAIANRPTQKRQRPGRRSRASSSKPASARYF